MRLHTVWISLVVIWSIMQTGCGGTQQPLLPQAKATFFETHDVFYLSPTMDGSPFGDAKIYGYQVEKSSGVVAPVPGSPYQVADGAAGQTLQRVGPMDPAHRFLLAARDLGQGNGAELDLFTISAQDGSLALSSTASVPRLLFGLTFDSTGHFVYASVDSLDGNSIFSFRIDGAKLTPIAVIPVPFQADFPKAVVIPGKQLLLVYGITLGDHVQHLTTFRIDREMGTLTPTGHTYVGTDLPFAIVGMDAPGNFLFGVDSHNFREFVLHDDGSIEEMASNALPFEGIGSGVDVVLGNPATNVLYMNTSFSACEVVLANYDRETGAMSISRPSETNCHAEFRLVEATSNFLFGRSDDPFPPDPRTVVVIYRLDPNGTIINQSDFPVSK